MKANKIMLALGGICAMSLLGCSDSDDASTVAVPPSTSEITTTETYSIKAIDGYLQNALVWLDLDQDWLQDDDEPWAISGAGGVADLDVSNILEPQRYPIVVHAIAGQTIDEDSDGTPMTESAIMSAPAGETNVTPLSTSVHLTMQELMGNANTPEEIAQAKQQAIQKVSGDLGIPEEQVLGDFIADNNPKAAYAALSIVASGQVLPDSPEQMQRVMLQAADDPTSLNQMIAAVSEQIRMVVESTDEDDLNVTPPPISRTDNLTLDQDADGIPDLLDAFPSDPNEYLDSDGDDLGNNADSDDDNDRFEDSVDSYPTDSNRAGDHDNDGIDSLVDSRPYDFDNDGYDDNDDQFPRNPLLAGDHDNDGFDSLNDAFPEDTTRAGDHDNDGYDSVDDAFPLNDKYAGDHDEDGFDSIIDMFPNDNTQAGDHDNDGYDSVVDAFPQDGSEWLDSDGDSIGDNSDEYPNDFDNDSYADDIDAFPEDATEWLDTDGDLIGNNADPDDDNDGYNDADDIDPLHPLTSPDTYSLCLESLPDYPMGMEMNSRSDGRLYNVSRLNVGQSNTTHYFQTELYVDTINSLPNGYAYELGNPIVVNQITTDFGAQANEWDPNLEFEYLDAVTGEYIGYRDHYDRWWGFNVSVTRAEMLPLNTPVPWSVQRFDTWSPIDSVTHNQFTTTYLGKEIITTELGLREVCVTQYQGQFDFVKGAGSTSQHHQMYVEDSVKNYVDKNKIIQRAEREYLEFDPSDKETPTWGYTNYVKQLEGFILNDVLYGNDPIDTNVPDNQPLTLDACLAELPSGVQPPTLSDSLTFDVVKRSLDGSVRTAIYHWELLTGEHVAWQDKTGLIESRLTGEQFDNGRSLGVFTERYYQDTLGAFQGMEAREEGSDDIKWGNVHLVKNDLTLESTYRIPEVESTHFRAVNADTQYGDWQTGDYVTNTVYVGKEPISYQINGETVTQEACRVYTSNQGSLYRSDGSLSSSENMQQVNWFDNNGLVQRETEKKSGMLETWTRSAVNGTMPIYAVCDRENTGEVQGEVVGYEHFLASANYCSYSSFDTVDLNGLTLYYQESEAFYYGYQFSSDGSGIYTESDGFSIAISWSINENGIIKIISGDDTEYFALVATEGNNFSLLGFYLWDEEGQRVTEIIGQEFSTVRPELEGDNQVSNLSELFETGLTWLWAELFTTGSELEYGTIRRIQDNAVYETYSEFDFGTKTFVTEVVNVGNSASDDRYVLTSNGTWEFENEAITQISVNPDNTLAMSRIHGDGFTNSVLSAVEVPLAGQTIATVLSVIDEGGSWAKFVHQDALFTEQAEAYRVLFSEYEYFSLETLSWWCDGQITQDDLNGMCNHILTDTYNAVINFAELQSNRLLVTWNQADQTEILMQFVGSDSDSGTVSFTNESQPLESGTWEQLVENGVSLIKVQAPLSVAQLGAHFADDGSLYLAEFNGFVRRVSLVSEGGEDLLFNPAAQDDILSAFVNPLNACAVGDEDDGSASLVEFASAISACGGSKVITEDKLIGRTLTIDYPDPHSEYMTLTFYDDNTVVGVDMNSHETWIDSWSIDENGYLKLFSGNGYVYWALIDSSPTQWSVKLLEQWEDNTDPQNLVLKQFITSGVTEFR
ncbi:hypothetical protein QF117_01065 [Vibrio sp. YMD68]|uniref:hypothetical protein n=1 Tax=Vibrio sp. YMD68 TaxID=3042300 RepID=UPI00249B016E|nr:hypothetical protein [Vibrio sp. YMD68]WGV98586.1 hypothetical protein QF117_01065 [Vibrio sp. YMD68]